jgi:hypothetical protein
VVAFFESHFFCVVWGNEVDEEMVEAFLRIEQTVVQKLDMCVHAKGSNFSSPTMGESL